MKQIGQDWLLGPVALASWVVLVAVAAAAQAEAPYQVRWIEQLAGTDSNQCYGVSADGLGNVYISGFISGVAGGPHAGSLDAFVSKCNEAGKVLWSRQLGTTDEVQSRGVSADGLGNVYISGFTAGSLGGPNSGGFDAFVSKYDAEGNLLWMRQLGTSENDWSNGVSADGLGNVYISGFTAGSLGGPNSGGFDAFVSKYDAEGNLLWMRQLGTSENDWSNGVSADGLGNVFISGATAGSLGANHAGHDLDAFVSKYDAQGNLLWTRQLGSSDADESYAVSADGLGGVCISGYTGGSLAGAQKRDEIGYDAFVSKFDTDGNLLWTKQIGAARCSDGKSVSSDRLGNVYLSGRTVGPFDGSTPGAFVRKYDAAGHLLWSQQIGTMDMYCSQGVSADRRGNVYLAGTTLVSRSGQFAVRSDAFVVKLTPAGEPALWMLAPVSIVIVLGLRFVMGRLN